MWRDSRRSISLASSAGPVFVRGVASFDVARRGLLLYAYIATMYDLFSRVLKAGNRFIPLSARVVIERRVDAYEDSSCFLSIEVLRARASRRSASRAWLRRRRRRRARRTCCFGLIPASRTEDLGSCVSIQLLRFTDMQKIGS